MLQVIHMNGRHPIDDLFARGLRDAEATPPAAVWEGIARRRGRGYITWLRLRQRWRMGVLALLLLGGAAAYRMSGPTTSPGTPAEVPGTGRQLAEAPATLPQAPTNGPATEPAMPPSSGAAAGTTPSHIASTSAGTTPTAALPAAPTPTVRTGAPAHSPSQTPSAARSNRADRPAAGSASPEAPRSGSARTARTTLTPPAASTTIAASSPTAASAPAEPAAPPSTREMVDDGFVRQPEASDLFPSRLFPAPAKLARPAAGIVPDSRTGQPYVLPKADWWIGVQAGYYQETRTWHGTDRQLADGLNSTETTHHPWGVALLGGRAFRSGWGFSTGAEYISAQYAFQHDDRIITRNQEINSVLVTLNAQVVDQFVDTVVTITEQQRSVEAINRYAIVRVPLEASFHKNFGRWSYGLRAGAAVELLRMRSGFTLSDAGSENGATYSVPVTQGSSRTRSATLLSLGAGAELGYALTDRIGLWLAPTYVRGWMPLGEHDLYALPERAGLRFRVSYTLPSPR